MLPMMPVRLGVGARAAPRVPSAGASAANAPAASPGGAAASKLEGLVTGAPVRAIETLALGVGVAKAASARVVKPSGDRGM